MQKHQFSEFTTALELGLTNAYRDTVKLQPKQYGMWLKEVPAQQWFDTDWMVSGLGVMPTKDIGGEIQTDKILQGPTKQFDLQSYALAITMDYELIRWDLYGIFPGLVRQLAKTATDQYNLVTYDLLNLAFTAATAEYQTYRSEVPVTTAHTRLDGGTWSNQLASNDGLSYEGIQKALTLLRKTVNERGRFEIINPRWLHTSVDQEWIGETLLNSTLRPMTTDNDMNTLMGKLRCIASVYFTATLAWFLQCPKGTDCFKVNLRVGDAPDLMRDYDPRTRNRIMTSACSFKLAVFDTRGLVGSTGAGS